MNRHLLLISNSISYNQGYLDHCMDEIINFLGSIKTILFIPYAIKDKDCYTLKARKRFEKEAVKLISIHSFSHPKLEIEKAAAIFVGGGNTFRLLHELYNKSLIPIIRRQVNNGMHYIGVSAGANIACPTIKTTNDMPIIYPSSFNSLNLVSFQINPHYFDTDPNSKHMGETREERIKEFHEENNIPVIGLREGSYLRIENNVIELKGKNGAKIFKPGQNPIECKIGRILL